MTSFRAIIDATAAAHDITPRIMLAQDRRRQIARPRQIAMALCRELPRASLPAVAHAFGRDHTTVLHAIRAVEERMTPELADLMDAIRAKVAEAAE